MNGKREWLARLGKYREELTYIAERVAEACAKACEYGREPREIFACEWNHALDQGDPHHIEMMRIDWCWMEAGLRDGRAYRNHIVAFTKRCQAHPDLAHSDFFEQSLELAAERLQHGVCGLAATIRLRKTDKIREERQGDVQMDWQESPEGLDGKCFWLGEDLSANPPLLLRSETQTRMASGAEIRTEEYIVFADLMLRDLREGTLSFPEFRVRSTSKERTVLHWQEERLEPLPLEQAPRPPQRFDLQGEPYPIELELWDTFPEARDAVASALEEAATADKPLIDALRQITGRNAWDVKVLLSPLTRSLSPA